MQKLRERIIKIGKRVLFYLVIIIIWELAYKITVDYFGIWKSYSFPSPIAVAQSLIGLISDNTLLIAVIASLKRLAIGYSISLIIGLTLGLIIVKFKYLDENLSPLILGLQTLPSICWLPFAILWYGLNESAIMFIIAMGSSFAITLSIVSGIKNVNPQYIKAAKTMGTFGIKIQWYVTIPAALPSIASGMKQAWSFAWRALMAGEMLSASVGLGQILMMGRDLDDISQVVAVMAVIILLGIILDKLVFGKMEEAIRNRWGLS